jgi:hypothetical protein
MNLLTSELMGAGMLVSAREELKPALNVEGWSW